MLVYAGADQEQAGSLYVSSRERGEETGEAKREVLWIVVSNQIAEHVCEVVVDQFAVRVQIVVQHASSQVWLGSRM